MLWGGPAELGELATGPNRPRGGHPGSARRLTNSLPEVVRVD
jgi:hypothetical protein